MLESDIQKTVVEYLRLASPGVLFTISPAGVLSGNKQQRIIRHQQNKAMGYRKGTPDLMIFKSNSPWLGLHIELKTKYGKQTEEQKLWQVMANSEGYKYVVCKSFEEAKEVIDKYLGVS